MKERDYLWCLVNSLLDGEEALERLCPTCRGEAEGEHCPRCGCATGGWGEGAVNTAFDSGEFERKGGGT